MSRPAGNDAFTELLVGLGLGALAGAMVSLADFGAGWLWLSWSSERGVLAIRTLALGVPLLAIFGALAGLSIHAGQKLGRPTLFLMTILCPWLLYIAWRLFDGGKMSQLPMKPLLLGLVAALLMVGAWAYLRTLMGVVDRVAKLSLRNCLLPALLLVLFFVALSKANQHLYPRHYDYLHALLSVLSFSLALASVYVLAARPAFKFVEKRPLILLVIGLTCMACLWTNLRTISANENIRVALLSPRAANLRPAMTVFSAWRANQKNDLASTSAIDTATRARELRRYATGKSSLPTSPGAHVLLITIDALRADRLGAYGYEKRPTTPYIDSLAESSLIFEHAYAAAPHSSYSIASLLTSNYLHERVELNIPLPSATLATVFESLGYRTASYFTDGIFHTEGARLKTYAKTAFGFRRHDHATRNAEALTSLVLEDFDRVIDEGERPSFVWAHYFDVHEPYEDTRFGLSDEERYDGEIAKVDQAVKRLVQSLDRKATRDVIVVITADHGEEFKDHGGVYHGSTLYDEQVRVPLVIRTPFTTHRRVKAPVSLVDLAPTLLYSVGGPPPASMRGDDLRPLFFDESELQRPVFSAVSHLKMVLRWPYKLVANLRFDLFELYDLSTDPNERNNLATQNPAVVDSLKGEIHAWLDSLNDKASPYQLALQQGRLRDRRAVEKLAALAADRSADTSDRKEACRLLGHLADPNANTALIRLWRSNENELSTEAAIALGRMYNHTAKATLLEAIDDDDPDVAARAAVSLARLRDKRAVNALIRASETATDTYEREEITRWIGRLRDPIAFPALLRLLKDFETKFLAVTALGQLGDIRAYDVLVDLETEEKNATVRDNIARAFGQLHDRRAIPIVVAMAKNESHLTTPSEALIRLGATAEDGASVVDINKTFGRKHRGFIDCVEEPPLHDWNYLHRTHCTIAGETADVIIETGNPSDETKAATLLVGARSVESMKSAILTLELNNGDTFELPVDSQWKEHRLRLSAPLPERLEAKFRTKDQDGKMQIDHLILLSSSTH